MQKKSPFSVSRGLKALFGNLEKTGLVALLISGAAFSLDMQGVTNLCVDGAPNGVFEPGEECDTGDPSSADGCDSNCRVVDGWFCDNPVAIGPLSFEAYPGSGAQWNISADGRTALQTANTTKAAFGLVGAPAFSATYTFEGGVTTTVDDDFFGFALGFEPGETGFDTDTDYLLLSWKQADQQDARRGLALLHVSGGAPTQDIPDNPLWRYGYNPQPPVSVLAWGSASADVGWVDSVMYDWEIEYRQDTLIIIVDGVEEFNLEASDWPDRFPDGFPDGRVAFYGLSQQDTRFTITGPFEPSVCAVSLPGPPSIGTATAGNAQATVSFSPPVETGGGPITSYTATSFPDGHTGTCAESPCTVTGLTNGTDYTFTVFAINDFGDGPESGHSNTVTPLLPTYTVTTLANNGTITSAVDPVVELGQATTVTGQADANHYFSSVDGCDGTQQTNSDQSITDFSYETGAIEADCTVLAEFSIRTYSMSFTVSSGQGTIDVLTPVVDHGSDATFEVTPEIGWSLQSLTGDTCSPSDNGDGTWTATAITSDCEVTAEFIEDTTTVLSISMSPAIVGIQVTYTIRVTGSASAPADGQVELISDLDGVICSLPSADSVNGQTAIFVCKHTWSFEGVHQMTATFSESGSHGDDVDLLQQLIVSDEFIFNDRFSSEE